MSLEARTSAATSRCNFRLAFRVFQRSEASGSFLNRVVSVRAFAEMVGMGSLVGVNLQ